jgi:hypothetical protein
VNDWFPPAGMPHSSSSIATPACCLAYYTIRLTKKCNHFVETLARHGTQFFTICGPEFAIILQVKQLFDAVLLTSADISYKL